jgi:hypothetical protein
LQNREKVLGFARITINIRRVFGVLRGSDLNGGPLHHYHYRAFYIGVLSVILIVIGLLALNFPVFIDAYDQWGWQLLAG